MSGEDMDIKRRTFLIGTTCLGLVGTGFVAVPFLKSMNPSDRAKAAGAPVEIDISQLRPGDIMVEEWRGKPVWVVRRTPSMLASLKQVEDEVADPVSRKSNQPAYAANPYRSLKEEYLVVVGICTHLGCSPDKRLAAGAVSGLGDNWQGGFFCPCHGSKFDLAGRVYKNVPAPTNLDVPPYHYKDANTIIIGIDPRDKKGAA